MTPAIPAIPAALASLLLCGAVGCCQKKPNPQPLAGMQLPPRPAPRFASLPDSATEQQVADAYARAYADAVNYYRSLEVILTRLGAEVTPPASEVANDPNNPADNNER